MVKDQKGNIWIGTAIGLNRIVNTSRGNSQFLIRRGINKEDGSVVLANARVLSLLSDSKGVLWVGTTQGLYKVIAGEDGRYSVNLFLHQPASKNSISDNTVRAFYEDDEGNIWIGTNNGLNMISFSERNKSVPVIQKYFHTSDVNSLSHNVIYAVSQDKNGKIWIGTDGGGINIYDKKKDRFISYQHDPLDKMSLSINEIRSLYRDKSGIMWVGTYGGGLNKAARGIGQFYHYRHIPDEPNSLSHSIVWSFYQDDDSVLWIGTHNGLDKLDRKTNVYRHYIPDDINTPRNQVIRVVVPYKDGRLLIGTGGSGIYEFNTKSGAFRNWSNDPGNPNSLIHNEIRTIYVDKEGIVWIGTFGRGMDRFDPETGIFKHYFNIPDDTASISHDYIRAITEDDDGYLWIGTEGGGLNKFDKKKEQFEHFRIEDSNPYSLTSNHIFSIVIESPEVIWLGTYGGGLNKFNPVTKNSRHYNDSSGLPSNSIYGIIKDKHGYLWMSTTNGLARFDPVNEKFKNFNIKDGLQENEFNGGSYYQSKSGELFFGGINGFNSFYPENIKDYDYIPPVVLTSFKKFNKEVNYPIPLTSVKKIVLPYSDNVFSFEFAALDYFAPEKNQYAYQLEGVDKDLVFVNADKRFAAYTTLSPGEYVFYVKGSNADGVWNQEGIRVIIEIIPPFWQRAWFILLIVLIIIGTAYLLYLRRLKIIRMKVELKTAHDAQLSIMPRSDPLIEELDVSGVCIPANEVGGDFFDYFPVDGDNKKFGIILGDVSGKAMKAAVTAIMTSGMIISEIRSGKCISKILESLNSTLISKIEKKMFVSLCISVIDTDARTISFANAGLNRPIILSDGKVNFLYSQGPRLPLGIKGDVHYQQTNFSLKKGDIIIFTTDGVDEAQTSNRELFGVDRLKKHIMTFTHNGLSASEMKNSIIGEVRKFIKHDKLDDDMTVLVVKMK